MNDLKPLLCGRCVCTNYSSPASGHSAQGLRWVRAVPTPLKGREREIVMCEPKLRGPHSACSR